MSRDKDPERDKIAQDTAAFLANGGEIQQHDHTSNATYTLQPRRTRKEQVHWMRKFGALRGKPSISRKD